MEREMFEQLKRGTVADLDAKEEAIGDGTPERIWLYEDSPDYYYWADRKQDENDIAYVRADVHNTEIERLRKALHKIAAGRTDMGGEALPGHAAQEIASDTVAASKANANATVKTEPIKGGRRLICRVCEKAAHWLNFDQVCEDCL